MNVHILQRQEGYIALISVLIVGLIGMTITTSLLLLGVENNQTGIVQQQSNQSKVLADACIEEALQQISDSTPFTGTDTISLGQGSCTYTVTSQGGQNRTITATGTVDDVIRKTEVIIDKITPSISVVLWQEVADF